MLADVCLALIAVGLTAYAVLGFADFGAGFWDLTAGGPERGARMRALIQRSMGPVWEANHVWLIFVLVVLWTAFPVAFGSIMSTLYVPMFLVAAGIIFRGTAFAVRGEAATIGEARVLGAAFATSSVLVPFCLGTAIGGVVSGRVPVGNVAGDPVEAWLNPTSISLGVLAVVLGAFLAAAYMAADAKRDGLDDLVPALRKRSLASGVAAGALAIGELAILREDARTLYDGLTSGTVGPLCLAASAAAAVATIALVWRERFEAARWSAAAAVAAFTAGWAFAQHPWLLPGHLTVEEAAADETTLIALLGAVGAGVLVLAPSLWLLYRLALRGSFGEGLAPLTTGDRSPEP